MFDLSIVEKNNLQTDGFVFDVEDGQIQLCQSLEWVRQKIRNLLQTWQDEWFLDVTYGIDYKSQLGKSRQELIILEIKSKISGMNEVSQVVKCSSSFDEGRIMIDLAVLVKGEVLNFKVSQNV